MSIHHRQSVQTGDITGWARATDSFRRPLDMKLSGPRERGAPVRDLGAVRAYHARPEVAGVAERVCGPLPEQKGEVDVAARVDHLLAISDRLNAILMPHLFRTA